MERVCLGQTQKNKDFVAVWKLPMIQFSVRAAALAVFAAITTDGKVIFVREQRWVRAGMTFFLRPCLLPVKRETPNNMKLPPPLRQVGKSTDLPIVVPWHACRRQWCSSRYCQTNFPDDLIPSEEAKHSTEKENRRPKMPRSVVTTTELVKVTAEGRGVVCLG